MSAGRPQLRTCAALAAFLLGACEGAPDPGVRAPWPQWRGPTGQGTTEASPLPTRWSADSTNIRWRAAVPGLGTSSPVIGGGLAIVTTAIPVSGEDPAGDHERSVVAYDTATGERRWLTPVLRAPAEKRHTLNSPAGPTPATDGERIWAYFGSTLAALDASGEIAWSREIDPNYRQFTRYGAASSVVLAGGAVVVTQDKEWAQTDDVGWLAAFDRETGEQLWRTEWTHTCCSYSTPIVVERGGHSEIVIAQSGAVVSYALDDGRLLWTHHYPMMQVVSSPLLAGDLLLILGGADRKRGNVGVSLAGAGEETTLTELWSDPRLVPQASSPVLYRGLLYSLTLQGVLVARQPQSGEIVWRQRLARGRNHASLAAGDGKVYASSTSGLITVLAAPEAGSGAEPQILAENDLGERGSTASLAFGDGCLVVRSLEHLLCIEAEAES